MTLPGFTAENALRKSEDTYQGVVLSAEIGQGVVPQVGDHWTCYGDYCCNSVGYCLHTRHYLM